MAEGGRRQQGPAGRFGAEHPFRVGGFQLVPHISAEWSDRKYVDYYYGVPASEATAARPAHAGDAATEVSAGLRINYPLQQNQLILLDISEKHRGDNVSRSPLGAT